MEKLIPQLRFPEFKGEWYSKKFKELFDFYSTNSFSRDLLNYSDGTIYNIHYGDIHTKFKNQFFLTKETVPYINNDVILNKSKSLIFCNEGDLIIADASENYEDIGKSIELIELNNQNVVAGLHTLHARPKHKLSIGFSGFYTQTNVYKNQIKKIAQGTKVLGLSSKRVNDINISIPSLEEQTKITNFLGKVDKQIEILTSIKEKLEAYKKGTMQQLFNQELCFKKDDGSNYPDWEENKLGEIIEKFIVPMRDKPKDLAGNIPWCRIEDFEGIYLCKSKTSQGVTEETVASMNLKVFPVDTLLVSCSANLGVCAIVKEPLVTNQTFIGLVPNFSKVNVEFLYYEMTKNAPRLNRLSSGTTISYLSREAFENFKILLPKIEEQTKIANFLSAIDRQIEQVDKQIDKSKAFKKGLLQQMFV